MLVRRRAQALGSQGEGRRSTGSRPRLSGLHEPAQAGFAPVAEGFTPTARHRRKRMIPLANCRIGRSGGRSPPVISSFLVLVVGFADHEYQKNDLFRGRGDVPAGRRSAPQPRWRVCQQYHATFRRPGLPALSLSRRRHGPREPSFFRWLRRQGRRNQRRKRGAWRRPATLH
jgi:hypothetical protein